jgi:hypothetical protein
VGGEGLRYGRSVCEVWVDRWVRYGWIGGWREKVRGVYGFSSLMKQKIKAKNCAVFCFAGKRKIFFIYL